MEGEFVSSWKKGIAFAGLHRQAKAIPFISVYTKKPPVLDRGLPVSQKRELNP